MALNPADSGAGLRVLVLSKRQYMGHDLIDDRYGRFRELPLAVAAEGASVAGICLSYRRRPAGRSRDEIGRARVDWTSLNLGALLPFGSGSYLREVDRLAEGLRPQVVWACSDVLHARLGGRVAARLGAKLVIDLYDNFESYPVATIPGVNAALRSAVRSADGVTCVSAPLERKIRTEYSFRGRSCVIENAIPESSFGPGDKQSSRRRFGLPDKGFLIGTAGALSRGRGTELLLEAFERLSRQVPDAHLVLAGARHSSLQIPGSDRIHYLGLLPAAEVPQLLPALDLSVVGNVDSDFGRYCFPQKLYESLACRIPVAVARVGAMAELLQDHPASLYEPGDVDSLLATLQGLHRRPSVPALEIPTWQGMGGRLASFLREVIGAGPAG